MICANYLNHDMNPGQGGKENHFIHLIEFYSWFCSSSHRQEFVVRGFLPHQKVSA